MVVVFTRAYEGANNTTILLLSVWPRGCAAESVNLGMPMAVLGTTLTFLQSYYATLAAWR